MKLDEFTAHYSYPGSSPSFQVAEIALERKKPRTAIKIACRGVFAGTRPPVAGGRYLRDDTADGLGRQQVRTPISVNSERNYTIACSRAKPVASDFFGVVAYPTTSDPQFRGHAVPGTQYATSADCAFRVGPVPAPIGFAPCR